MIGWLEKINDWISNHLIMSSKLNTLDKPKPKTFKSVSVWFFVFTEIVYLLQLFPVTGIFLLILGAPLWSILTINLGFLIMAYEAMVGRVPQWFMLFPLLYFCGYLGVAGASHMQFSQLQKELSLSNPSIHIPFDTHNNALVIGQTNYLLGGNSRFVEMYDLPVVYEQNNNFKEASYISYRIAGKAICDKVGRGTRGVNRVGFSENGIFVDGLCSVYQPENPTLPIYVVSAAKGNESNNWLLPTKSTVITITDPNGQSYNITEISAAPLSWIPKPVMGCTLNSGAGKWECDAGFLKNKFTALNPDGQKESVAIVADALGLKYAPASTRIAKDKVDPVIEKNISSYDEKESQDELDRFHNLITNLEMPDWKFPFLKAHPELTASEAPAMVQAFKRATQDDHMRQQRNILGKMISLLPRDVYLQQSPILLEIVRSDRPDNRNGWSIQQDMPDFMTRLGDSGPESYDIFLTIINIRYHTEYWTDGAISASVLALCRAGTNAAPKVGPDLIRLFNSTDRLNKSSELHSALYVTLLRMGLKDAVLADPSANQRYDKKWYENKLATVTPSSPKTVCVTNSIFSQPLPE